MEQPFDIEHIDPLGQGVSKIGNKIAFIRKTLPGEKGQALIYKQSKGVSFGIAKKITSPSPDRKAPDCPHYEQCSGCHYLHTSYEAEISFKKQCYERDLAKFTKLANPPQLKVHTAPHRLGYRTRIQLHYDRNKKLLGFVDPLLKKITPVPHCQIAESPITAALTEIYQQQKWASQATRHQGHLEIAIDNDGQLLINFDRPYSAGGFRQVYPAMNNVLLQEVNRLAEHFADQIGRNLIIWDLFGGSGNLSQNLEAHKVAVVDSYIPEKRISELQKYLQTDLYAEDALSILHSSLDTELQNPDVIMIDPPRSGFKELATWIETKKPRYLVYVSCHHATQLRDLSPVLENYQLIENHLLDFFPATFHFETLTVLMRSS